MVDSGEGFLEVLLFRIFRRSCTTPVSTMERLPCSEGAPGFGQLTDASVWYSLAAPDTWVV
jgi:hypothetical protein